MSETKTKITSNWELSTRITELKNQFNFDMITSTGSYKSTKEEAIAFLNELDLLKDEIKETNITISASRHNDWNDVEDFLKNYLPLYDHKKNGKVYKKHIGSLRTAFREQTKYKEICTYGLECSYKKVEEHIQSLNRREKEKEIKTKDARRKEVLIEFAEEHLSEDQFSIAKYMSSESLEEFLKDLLYNTKYINTTVEISSCDECEEYTVGHNRCSCGNRRISAYVELWYDSKNDKIEDFLTTEAY